MSRLLISDVITIDEIEKIVQDSLKNYKNFSCYLFGSYAKNSPTNYSDIDLLLLFDREKYNYQLVYTLQDILENNFRKIIKYCRPIYGYIDKIDDDSSILFRQYVSYGILMYGSDIKQVMRKETKEELKVLEYSHYWMPMYLKKIQFLEDISSNRSDITYSSLIWQYLFLALYWYAKAQLTLIDKQNSLNNFTLTYIYTKLLKFTLSKKEHECLYFIQKYRDNYIESDYTEYDDISFFESFRLVKKMLSK